ncbi:small nuclear ribonucleoprotein SmD3b-like [Castanea sativa]|uniref:small nuclear ribonucleoprotein SmD3b-like n=1 Tax=Castanea sativa TaxID=21020 RepID=UPI003F64AD22
MFLILFFLTYAQDGKVQQLKPVFIRGSKVRFMVILDMLMNVSMFKRQDARITSKGATLGVGRGRAVAMLAKAIVKFRDRLPKTNMGLVRPPSSG